MVKKYLNYLWKKTNKLVLIWLLVSILLYPVVMLVEGQAILFDVTRYEDLYDELGEWIGTNIINTGYQYVLPSDTFLFMLTILLMVSAYVVPLIVQGVFQNKKRCDNLFALPIKREVQILLSSAYGLVMILAVWWITALVGLGTSFLVHLHYNVGYFFLYLLVLSALAIGVYGITTLYAALMNSILDSVLLVIISLLIPVFFTISMETYVGDSETIWLFSTPIYAANHFTMYFQQEVAFKTEGLKEFLLNTTQIDDFYYLRFTLLSESFETAEIGAMISTLCLGLCSHATSFLLWRKIRAEEIQTPSNKWYSYPLVFSVLMFFLFFIFNFITMDADGVTLLVVTIFVVLYFVGFFIFQRKIKFTKTNLTAFAIILILANILALVMEFIPFPPEVEPFPIDPDIFI